MSQTILEVLNKKHDIIKAQVQRALPKHLSAERMIRILTTEINKNSALLQCTPQSVLSSVIQCSQLGLEPGGALGHAYLIPYNNRKANIVECQFIVGYRGMIDLALRSGKITNIRAKAVYANDSFEYEDGLQIILKHTPTQGDRGEFIGAYAVAQFANVAAGGYQVEFMYKNEIDKIKNRSKPKDYSPWITDYEEMAKKTVIRRLFKYLPISIEMQKAIAIDEAGETGNQLTYFEDVDVLRGIDLPIPETKTEEVSELLNK